MLNIVFRVDSSTHIGIGHLMRSLTLAKEFHKLGQNVIFASQNLVGNLNEKIVENGFQLEVIQSNSPQVLKSIIKKNSIDLVVFDSYEIGYNYEKDISSIVKVISFDDTYLSHFSDFIINQNIHFDKSKYKESVPKKSKILGGLKYALIREEFKNIEIPNKREGVLVTLGGSDENNETLKIIKRLDKNRKVTIVLGQSNPNIEKIEKYCKDTNFQIVVNTNSMATLMAKHKIAITAGGSTTIEALFMKMPLILKSIASNQDEIVETIVKSKVGLKIKKDIESQITLIEKEYKKYQKNILKLKISDKNVAKKIVFQLVRTVNFTKISLKEAIEALKYRNNYFKENGDIMTLKEQLKFIEKLKKDKTKKYFLVKIIDTNIGIIGFEKNLKNKIETVMYPNRKLNNVEFILEKQLLKEVKKIII